MEQPAADVNENWGLGCPSDRARRMGSVLIRRQLLSSQEDNTGDANAHTAHFFYRVEDEGLVVGGVKKPSDAQGAHVPFFEFGLQLDSGGWVREWRG